LVAFESVNALIMLFINCYFSGRFISYPILEQFKDMASIFFISLFIGVVVYFADNHLIEQANFLRLMIGYILGLSMYFLLMKYLRIPVFIEFSSLVTGKIKFLRPSNS